MMFASIYRPAEKKFRSPEDVRRFEQQLANIRRLVHYNNRRAKAGLSLVSYPPALADFSKPW